ncbi:putative ABC transport system ATP-binding protein [Clostridium acetobutylicum]|uniref:ABC-type transporter, ATPase component n=1 Tax=Clostridium acetobutylicum (strain ATCC 824 / DSM 792 / JCM 1419 / IAM 19013 / LMG 5710 / NBRC 13948 / NRRL B-527 / VKM B-1787 / 2291 / W) TaxID=272562 RepID=Q97D95_CLOAB|nr:MULTISPECIES: ABC transporter ATP-binding protein [Clostridium]AAK81508.1 ABC-type transporter, ATPase component [Clostridium acetobutylicum ATCC 824]ADZ22629.1 ABC-type transporter, ATPase component [Clostridium acetobutylicum EA 2018]AEI34233.1 ABC-type transporter, ATPase component [Clostridium acetobutylicum DSM 1731]AWV80818.1 ABC transporter ATP-binding protein [Clostridium acetobutylicum]KHD36522.1 ABC transporter ATP-binding protein [Clostridium acetobutylicum]
MIEVKNVSKVYKMGKETVTALNNVNLKIHDGEFVAIVGPSGSGKSTLMHLVGGLDTPTSGSVRVDNKDISRLKDKEMSKYRNRTIGFVFQAFNLENTQTALENVMMPLIFAGIGGNARREKAKRALEMVGLGDKIKHRPSEMSGGQRQRVSIARALVNEPQIIFADEPTGNLDSKNGALIMKLLEDLNEKGYTIIMVTHNMEEAKKAKRLIMIKDGQVEEVDESEI